MSAMSMPDACLSWLEGACDMPVGFEQIATDPAKMPAVMLHPESVPAVIGRYKSGQRVERFRFSVYLRVAADDAAGRIDAMAALQALADAWEAGPVELPEGCTARGRSAETYPTMSDASEAYETYSVQLSVEYIANA